MTIEEKAYTVFRDLEHAVDVFVRSPNPRHTDLVVTEPLPETCSKHIDNSSICGGAKDVLTKRNSWRHKSL